MELNRLLSSIGVSRRHTYITNLVKDYENRDPELWEIERDTPELICELVDVHPKTVVTLGLHSTRFFMHDMDMEMCHGFAFSTGIISEKSCRRYVVSIRTTMSRDAGGVL